MKKSIITLSMLVLGFTAFSQKQETTIVRYKVTTPSTSNEGLGIVPANYVVALQSTYVTGIRLSDDSLKLNSGITVYYNDTTDFTIKNHDKLPQTTMSISVLETINDSLRKVALPNELYKVLKGFAGEANVIKL